MDDWLVPLGLLVVWPFVLVRALLLAALILVLLSRLLLLSLALPLAFVVFGLARLLTVFAAVGLLRGGELLFFPLLFVKFDHVIDRVWVKQFVTC